LAYKKRFKSSVEKDLRLIDKGNVRKILDKIDSELVKEPTPGKILSGKFKGLFRFRIGNYRVIYTISKDTVLILRIAHRKDAYKK